MSARRRVKGPLRWALLGLLLPLLGIVAAMVEVLVLFPTRPGPGSGRLVTINVTQGIGPKGLTGLLSDAGLISSPGRFVLWLRITGGLAHVKAGEFQLTDNLTPTQIVRTIGGTTHGKGTKVVIPEGFTLGRTGDALAQAGIVDSGRFVAMATNQELVAALGIPGPTFEGYLFPDTYYFDPDTAPIAVIRTMMKRFFETVDALGIPRDAHLKKVVTLASIVQAETGLQEEMDTVAGVYANRLTSPEYPSRLLQADPSVAYGCEPYITPRPASCATFDKRLLRAQLNDPENPYNTYKLPGLPPGPINAPGRTALKAAFKPKKVPYFFFVAKPDGKGHTFSISLKAHQQAVEAYWNR